MFWLIFSLVDVWCIDGWRFVHLTVIWLYIGTLFCLFFKSLPTFIEYLFDSSLIIIFYRFRHSQVYHIKTEIEGNNWLWNEMKYVLIICDETEIEKNLIMMVRIKKFCSMNETRKGRSNDFVLFSQTCGLLQMIKT